MTTFAQALADFEKDDPGVCDVHVASTAWGRKRKKPKLFSEIVGKLKRRPQTFSEVLKTATSTGLYVRRNLKNADELHAWASSAGIPNLVPPDEMHVTQVYSRDPVDLNQVDGDVTAQGGNRHIAPLGDQGAVVLHFQSPTLQSRWDETRAAGASWDYPSGYKPHVSLSYDAGGADLSSIQPPDFPLVFGPEIHEPLNENWAEDKGFRVAKYGDGSKLYPHFLAKAGK